MILGSLYVACIQIQIASFNYYFKIYSVFHYNDFKSLIFFYIQAFNLSSVYFCVEFDPGIQFTFCYVQSQLLSCSSVYLLLVYCYSSFSWVLMCVWVCMCLKTHKSISIAMSISLYHLSIIFYVSNFLNL